VAPNDGNADSYFRSGLYHFDNVGLIEVRQQSIWFGHPGALNGSEEIPNPACTSARDNDPNVGGPGAVAYFGGNSRLAVIVNGNVEFFPRSVDGRALSLQELEPGSGYPASSVTAASNVALIGVGSGANKQMVFHGQIYSPRGRLVFDNSSNTAKQQVRGGAVLAQVWIQASGSASGFEISVATTPFESDILLTATSTSPDGGSTTARAVVEYRVDETDPDKKVAVNSLRILD
jgi:hypothetical protein